MRWFWILLCSVVFIVGLLAATTATEACGPMPVIDINWASNFWRVVEEYVMKVKEYQMMLENFTKYTKILNLVKIPSFLTDINKKWNEVYKDPKGFSELNETGYAEQLKKIDQETSDALHQAANAQALLDEIGNDQQTLNQLMMDSASAVGEMQAIQAGNQIAALQTYQMMRLQEIMATSSRAQALYYQAQLQEKLAKQAYEAKNRIQMENPLTKATGGGLPLFSN